MSRPIRIDLRGTIPGPDGLSAAVSHLRSGGILAYPTETVYGFGGLCTPEAVARVRRLKGRAEDHPLLVLVPDPGAVPGLVWTPAARALADVFWPGAVTLVLADPRATFPDGIRSREGGVAVRVSPHPLVAALLELLGEPLTSTSANVTGGRPARSGAEALACVEETGAGEIVMVLDDGALAPSEPSTLVDCTGAEPVVLREGSVPLGRLRCALPGIHAR